MVDSPSIFQIVSTIWAWRTTEQPLRISSSSFMEQSSKKRAGHHPSEHPRESPRGYLVRYPGGNPREQRGGILVKPSWHPVGRTHRPSCESSRSSSSADSPSREHERTWPCDHPACHSGREPSTCRRTTREPSGHPREHDAPPEEPLPTWLRRSSTNTR